VGLLFAAFLVLTLYIYYVHWKYSHIPSPKMPRYDRVHNQVHKYIPKLAQFTVFLQLGNL